MKLNKPQFLMLISAIYLFFLLFIIWIYNPDFKDMSNFFLLIPLYIPLFISSHLSHKNDKYASGTIWATRFSLVGTSLIVVLLKLIVNYFR